MVFHLESGETEVIRDVKKKEHDLRSKGRYVNASLGHSDLEITHKLHRDAGIGDLCCHV